MPCVRRHQPGHTRSSALDVQAAQGGPAQASSRAGRSRVHPARCSAAGRGGCTRHPHRLRPRPPPTQPDHRLTTPHRTPPRPPRARHDPTPPPTPNPTTTATAPSPTRTLPPAPNPPRPPRARSDPTPQRPTQPGCRPRRARPSPPNTHGAAVRPCADGGPRDAWNGLWTTNVHAEFQSPGEVFPPADEVGS